MDTVSRKLFFVLILSAGCLPLVCLAESPLADAVMNGDHTAVESLLKSKVDVNAAQSDGQTALQWAAYRDDIDLAKELIAAGADPKLANREGATAMQLASLHGSPAMIEALLKAGADANEHGLHDETPLMFAARAGSIPTLDSLLKHGALVNAKESLRGTTALMWAVEQGHTGSAEFLIQHGADVSVASSFDSKGGTAYLAPTVKGRANQEKNFRRFTSDSKTGELSAKDAEALAAAFGVPHNSKGGGLTALILAAREGHLDCAKLLLDAHADVNQTSHYGWTPLLTAVQNRHYKFAAYLLDHGANPNIANNGGWSPLYIATDNRNIEGGDYPVRDPDMDHLDIIKLLLAHGANVNARICGVESRPQACKGDSTETRTIFTMQWLYEDGATPFLRAAQSGDVELMKLLLQHGADPKITTANGDTALMVASGIGWVEGVTYEWSEAQNLEAVKLCLDLGLDPNAVDGDGRTALHGAAHKGRNDVVNLLVARGAKLDAKDNGSRDTFTGALKGHQWEPIDYSRGLVRVGVQSAIAHPETEALLKKLMEEKGIPVPPPTNVTVCVTDLCKGSAQ
ncbi:MAG TPA: ankyrin repeat domain-containing protein [Bryobacteraceae bacterium]|nr:ankyrin repeat domain-containing protein [Bryobacteraceae bacterium]